MIGCLIVLIALAHMGDAATFYLAVALFGPDGEANPFARGLYLAWPPAVFLAKYVGIMLATIVLLYLEEYRRLVIAGAVLVVAAGLVGVAFNVTAIIGGLS